MLAQSRLLAAELLRNVPVRGITRLQHALTPQPVLEHVREKRYPYPASFRVHTPWKGSPNTLIGWQVHFRGAYELSTLGILAALIQPGDGVVEGGANEGYHSTFIAELVGKAGRLWAFEPNPLPRKTLYSNTQGLSQVSVHHEALAAEPAESRDFFVPRSDVPNQGLGGLAHNSTQATEKVAVRIETIDRVVGESPVSLIKLDVQGFEHEVMAGAKQVVARDCPFVLFESMPDETSGKDVAAMLEQQGYSLWRIDELPTHPYFSLAPAGKLETFGNYLGMPAPRARRRS
ncbi:MAG TPA: FkbM family methyltransferase [Polyangium sp.]|nr:FkbM family methyltransferase [Polyangium sp.]